MADNRSDTVSATPAGTARARDEGTAPQATGLQGRRSSGKHKAGTDGRHW